jgi:2-polyprenyl-6-hydroxyphenyl methylase/3-demethylubiquinone-9 3-methyltransferase
MDRVAEVYNGERFSKIDQEILRDRLHWIADQVVEGPVLDLGCSQGTGSWIIASQGFDVLGVDLQGEAIAYALENYRDKATGGGTLDYKQADLFSYADGREYGTVVLGEVIEHFENPAEVIGKAASHLRDGGRLIITTPYGVHPEEDHSSQFSVPGFVRILPDFASVISLDTRGGYINCVMAKGSGPVPAGRGAIHATTGAPFSAEDLLELEISASIDKSRTLYAVIAQVYERLTGAFDRSKELQSRLDVQTAHQAGRIEELLARNKILYDRAEAAGKKAQDLAKQLKTAQSGAPSA